MHKHGGVHGACEGLQEACMLMGGQSYMHQAVKPHGRAAQSKMQQLHDALTCACGYGCSVHMTHMVDALHDGRHLDGLHVGAPAIEDVMVIPASMHALQCGIDAWYITPAPWARPGSSSVGDNDVVEFSGSNGSVHTHVKSKKLLTAAVTTAAP